MHTQQQRGSDITLASMEQNTHEEGQAHPKVARKWIGNIPKKQGEAFHSHEGTLVVCWSLGLRRSYEYEML